MILRWAGGVTLPRGEKDRVHLWSFEVKVGRENFSWTSRGHRFGLFKVSMERMEEKS